MWRRAAEAFIYREVLARHRVLLALTWLLVLAQRLHLVPKRFGLPRIDARQLRTPLDAAPSGAGDTYLLPGCVMDAWNATCTPTPSP